MITRPGLHILVPLYLVMPAVFAASAEPLHLPIQIIESGAITEITVGTRKVDVGIDTGGGGIHLTEEVIRAAGGVPLKKKGYGGTDGFGNKVASAPLFRIPLLIIGGQAFRNIEVARADPQEEGPPVPNSIGRRFLHRYLVVIDYPGSSIHLWSPDTEPTDAGCGPTRLPMARTRDSELAVSTFITPSGSLRLVWDTGATYSMLAEPVVKDLLLETFLRGDTAFYTPKSFIAGGKDFAPLEFVVLPLRTPERAQGFLGANFFSNHRVCLDYRKRQVLDVLPVR
jgi:hypothetical protein